MIDIKLLRDDVEKVIKALEKRNDNFDYLRDVVEFDKKRRSLISEVEKLKSERNEKSKQIGLLKKNKEDATEVMERVRTIGDDIVSFDKEINELEQKIKDLLLVTPNILHESVVVGKTEADNKLIKTHLEIPKFDFEVKSHYDLGLNLDILDFERATKIAGSRFVIYKGLGARLERALISFMMDLHSNKHGYTEIIPPYIVNRDAMTGTGQLPKFEEDAFKFVNNPDWFLNPTAEVPTINMYREEILDGKRLPEKFVSYTTAFRSEAGSAGRDTRGLIRTHQFNKVELIKFSKPEDSYKELDLMLQDSERVLQLLEIPYRVVSLCSGDMGFAMAKTYDIEVWIPSQNKYREIGSISNAEDFQARRANIRFKPADGSKLEFVHTLNGSGLAVGRTWVAIVENFQQKDGSIKIPKVLIPYMNVEEIRK